MNSTKNMRKLIVLTGIYAMMFLPKATHSQSAPGSPYTYFGIGDIYNKGFGYHLMKGGTGIADRSAYAINNLNPASYSAMGYPFSHLNEFGFSVASATREDGDEQGRQIDLDFPYLAMAFKTGDKSGGSVGLRKFSNVSYDIFGFNDFNGIPGQYRVRYQGSGGLNEFYFGYGRSIGKRLSIGVHFAYLFGSLKNDQQITSADIDYNVSIQDDNFLNAINIDLGAQYVLPLKKSTLTFGLTYDPRNNLNSSRELILTETEAGTSLPLEVITELDVEEEEYILPHSLGFGVNWNRNNKFQFSFDAQTQFWSQSSLEGDDYSLRDSQRASIGFEKLPNYNSESYWGYISWGFGAYAEQSYLVLEEEGLDNAGVTMGLNLPIGQKGMIRLIGERAFRGQQLSDFFGESYTKLTLNVTFMDFWFRQRKYN